MGGGVMYTDQVLNRSQVAEGLGVVGGSITAYVNNGWAGVVELQERRNTLGFTPENVFSLMVCAKVAEYLTQRDVAPVGEYIRARWYDYGHRGAGIDALAEKLLVVQLREVALYRQIDCRLHGLNGQGDGVSEPDPSVEMQVNVRLDTIYGKMVEMFAEAEAKVTA